MQDYVLFSEKYVKKLEADREALLEAAKACLHIVPPYVCWPRKREVREALELAIAKAEGREAQ